LKERLAALWTQDNLPRARVLIETLLRVGKAARASEADKHRRLRQGNAAVRNRILWAGHTGHELLLWLGFELSPLGKFRGAVVVAEGGHCFIVPVLFLLLLALIPLTLLSPICNHL